jgi:4-phospho-D-threonate 3-dehydrogenase / 4-phospho-D-erythronate 3-dehydrogenase
MRKTNLPVVAMTMGDPAGVGPEVLLKSLKAVRNICVPVIICDEKFLKKEAKKYKASLDGAELVDMDNITGNIPAGKVSKLCGRAAADYIETAVSMALDETVDAIVTAPINKESFHLAGIKHPGHTEMLAELTGTKEYAMMLTGGFLRVVLVTTHVAISKVPELVTKENIMEKIELAHLWLTKHFKIKNPRIAVAGLNPHSGDNGLFGNEEAKEIIPAVKQAIKQFGRNIIGPVVPDALFYLARTEGFDAIVCMYHDQGLIPLKMTAFEEGVNVTLGLPIIRTSPDHGTAFNIAGKGIASPKSFIEAVKLAAFLAR